MSVAVSTASTEEVTDGSSYVRVIDALAAAGVVVGTPGPTQAYVRCPAHDDHEPSLSVTWKVNKRGGGETFVYCQRKCNRHDVLATIGLVDADRYDTPPFRGRSVSPRVAKSPAKVANAVAKSSPRGEGGEAGGEISATASGEVRHGESVAKPVAKKVAKSSPQPKRGETGGGTGGGRLELVATYIYRGEDGEKIFDIRRWRGGMAKFSARRYDKNGKQTKGAPATARRVLYNLPAVLASDANAGGVVYLCEGEKDADAVGAQIDAGGPSAATTAPFGAGDSDGRFSAVWLPQYTEALHGKFVRIICDRDAAGWKHALRLLEELAPVAFGVEVVEPVAGNDAHDHLAAGYGLADLVALTRDDLVARIASGETGGEEHGEAGGEISAITVGGEERGEVLATAVGETSAMANIAPAPATPGETGGEDSGETGGEVLPFPGRGDGDGGDAGDGRRPGGGGGWGDVPRRRIILRDKFEANPEGLFKVKTDVERDRAGAVTQVTELLTEILPVRVRLAGRWVEDLCDGSPALMTHVDLVADRDGETHTMRAVELDRWKNCTWVNELPWPAPFQDTGGGRSTLRNAIMATSGPVPLTVMYGVLGWQEIGGRWVYLHAGGGIDADGPVSDVRVKFDEVLAPFELPASPSTRAELRDALMASVCLFEVVPARVAAPLLGSAYRAPLGFSRTTVMPFGPKGSGKTGVAAFAVQHGAPGARHDKMPGAGAGEDAGTTTALEELRYRAGDTLLPLDDLAPDRGTERASVRCAVIARSQFNRTGKARGKREGGVRAMHPPRSLPLVTGEETTTVESAESRIVTLKVGRGDVNLADLELFDSNGDPERRAALTAALVRHYAPVKGTLDETLREKRAELAAELRDENATDPGLDTRHSESVADLAVGWWAMLAMAEARSAITAAEHAEHWARAWDGLVECKRHLMAGAARRTASDRVRELMRTLLMQGKATLRARDGVSAPADAALCGWEQDPINTIPATQPGQAPLPVWRERGEAIGWTDGEKVWLNPGAAHSALVAQSKREHDELTYTGRGLAEALADAGVIRTEDDRGIRRTTIKAPRIGTARPRVWEIEFSWLFDDEGDEDGTPVTPPTAPAPPAPIDTTPKAPTKPTTTTSPASSSAGSSKSTTAPTGTVATTEPTERRTPRSTTTRARRSTSAGDWSAEGRYGAVAAVLEPETAWLAVPGEAPERREIAGELGAMLEELVAVRLGHRDGRGQWKGASHAWGQVWISPAQRKALGWPTSVEESSSARKVTRAIEAAGWKVLGKVAGPWVRVARDTEDEAARARLILMVPEWGHTATSLGEDTATAEELARRLARYAETTGIAWQWSPAATGQQLAAVTRPRLLGTKTEQGRQGPALPPPAGKSNREMDFSWQRTPTEAEAEMPYAVLIDANALYLSAARSLPLAWGEYERIERPKFDKDRPGYWKIPQQRWDHPVLPDPAGPVFSRGERDTMWVTTPTLEALTAADMLDWQIDPIEGYLAVEELREAPQWPYGGNPPAGDGWAGQKGYGRLLRNWSESLKDARAELLGAEPDSTDAVVLRNVKNTYAHGVGRFDKLDDRPGEGQRRSSHPLWRPDFRHTIIAQGRYALFRKILKAYNATGAAPLAIMTDGLVYATSELPDLADTSSSAGIPEGFTRGTGLGQVSVEGVTTMDAVAPLLRRGATPARSVPGKSRGLVETIKAGLEQSEG